jgi:hypothetical protein
MHAGVLFTVEKYAKKFPFIERDPLCLMHQISPVTDAGALNKYGLQRSGSGKLPMKNEMALCTPFRK